MGGGLLSSSTLTFHSTTRINHTYRAGQLARQATGADRSHPRLRQGDRQFRAGEQYAMIVAYTDETGAPVLSLRGSTQVYSDTQLSMWVRHANGGMANALKKNPTMALMYRDPPARTTLTFQGRGRFVDDADVRSRVFDLAPEVEQKHDPGRIERR